MQIKLEYLSFIHKMKYFGKVEGLATWHELQQKLVRHSIICIDSKTSFEHLKKVL